MIYSQKDEKWAYLGIGNIMKDYGCLVTAIANLVGKTPDKILLALNKGECFSYQGILSWDRAVKCLGLHKYQWLPGNSPITKPIICETDYFAPRFPQHFFIGNPDGTCDDSLDGVHKVCPYKIVSQRFLS